MGADRTLIVGGGIAGCATAYWLSREYGHEVTLVDREGGPGRHSSGKNAAILRTAIDASPTRALAVETARFLRRPPHGFHEVDLLDECGLLVIGANGRPAWADELERLGFAEPVSEDERTKLAPDFRPSGPNA